MGIFETFSRRQKRATQAPELLSYSALSLELRVQLARAFQDTVIYLFAGELPHVVSVQLYRFVTTELGALNLGPDDDGRAESALAYFVSAREVDRALDILELLIVGLSKISAKYYEPGVQYRASQAIGELVDVWNVRFRQHAVGYQFQGRPPLLMRVDSQHLHSETVLPALQLVYEQDFKGADDEYRSAHRHYREGHYKECLNDCLKAFESTMKTICSRKKWDFDKSDTAKPLIAKCLQSGLLPPYMETHLAAIRQMLESGIPTLRNKTAGHGQGEQPVQVPAYYAEFVLHETATTIVFFIEAYKALK